MNKGMVEWTNMSVINRPIKNSKMSGENMNTLRKNVKLGKNVKLTSTNP